MRTIITQRLYTVSQYIVIGRDSSGITECTERDLAAWLARLDPAEILHDGNELAEALGQARGARTARPATALIHCTRVNEHEPVD